MEIEEIVQPEIEQEVEEAVEQPQPEEEKVPKGVQRRIDEITREKYEERRARERADAELAALRRELEEARQKIQPPEPPKILSNGAPDPDMYPAGRYDPDYLEALTDYKVQLRFAEQQQLQRQAKKAEQLQLLETQAAESYSDYNDALQNFMQHGLTQVQQFRDILADTDNPAEVAYYLGKNPEEMNALSQMSPTQALRYIGRIEAKITTQEPSAKPVSNAPKPITPLGSAKSTGANKDPDKMTFREYKAWREKT